MSERANETPLGEREGAKEVLCGAGKGDERERGGWEWKVRDVRVLFARGAFLVFSPRSHRSCFQSRF